MSVPLTASVDKNRIIVCWACLEESVARSLTVISLLFQSTTRCRYQVYTKFLLTYTAIYRRNRKVLPLGITALRPQSHFHLGTPYTYIHRGQKEKTMTNFGDGRGDQGTDFGTEQLYLECLLYRSFKSKHMIRNAKSIPGYRVSAWHLLTYLPGTEAETQPEEVSVLRSTDQNKDHQISLLYRAIIILF